MIPYNRPTIEQDDADAVSKVLLTTSALSGISPIVTEFEEKLAEYTGYKYAVATNSGTAALMIAVRAANEHRSNLHVHTTPLTFLATITSCINQAFFNNGLMLWDIDDSTLNMLAPTPGHTGDMWLPVDFGGLPHDDICIEFASRKLGMDEPGMLVVDSAHSLGAKLSTIPVMRTFSFHAVKTITTGEGGAVATNSEGCYGTLRSLVNHGRLGGNAYFISENYRLSAINAALGISQLKKIDRFVSRRKEIAARYHRELPSCLRRPFWSDNHAWHLYAIRTNKRNKLKKLLAEDFNIETQINYVNPSTHSALISRLVNAGDTPVASKASQEILSIPIFPLLTDDMQTYVIASLDKACRTLRL